MTDTILNLATELTQHGKSLHEIGDKLDMIARSLETEAADITEEKSKLEAAARRAVEAAKIARSFNVDVNVGVRAGCGPFTRHPTCGACIGEGAELSENEPVVNVRKTIAGGGSITGSVAARSTMSGSGIRALSAAVRAAPGSNAGSAAGRSVPGTKAGSPAAEGWAAAA